MTMNAFAITATRRPETEINHYLWLSSLGTIGVLGVIGAWLVFSNIVAATVSQGVLVVASDVKKVQHQTGGTVGEIFVRDGDQVSAGDLLMQLKDTVPRSNMLLVRKQTDEQFIRQARLIAERDSATDISFPPELAARKDDPEIAAAFRGERNLFLSRRDTRDGQRAQLKERIAQLRNEIDGDIAQRDATNRQLILIRDELVGVQALFKQNLVSITRLNTLQRDVARLDGEVGKLQSTIAQARGKIAELALQILQQDTDLRGEVVKDLRDVQSKVAELTERLITAEDVLEHIDIRSPESGRVHQLSIHTVGGVITAGEQIMQIVPVRDELVVDTNIPANEIDTVRVGQPALIKFSAFNSRTTPEIGGVVTRVSADLVKDQPNSSSNSGAPGHYVARIAIPKDELQKVADQKLLPGMPAEVHIRGAERSALSYFLKPLSDQLGRTFRER